MSAINNGGPAFPGIPARYNGEDFSKGMTLRDYFAAKAMAAILAGRKHDFSGYMQSDDSLRRCAWRCAMTSFTLPIPTYQCHKRVQALKIKAVVPNPRGYELHFEDERFCPVEFAVKGIAFYPEAGRYLVIPEGRPPTCMDAAAFEAGYTLVRADGMPFSKEERRLRRMLCAQRHGVLAYMDDGEASWGGDEFQRPTDYMRESLDEIERAWREAGLKRASAELAPASLTVTGPARVYKGAPGDERLFAEVDAAGTIAYAEPGAVGPATQAAREVAK